MLLSLAQIDPDSTDEDPLTEKIDVLHQVMKREISECDWSRVASQCARLGLRRSLLSIFVDCKLIFNHQVAKDTLTCVNASC